jgi:hypothetical protein
MHEQDRHPGRRLTRSYEQTQNNDWSTDPEWQRFRARLFAELAPRSLKDRLLAEAIETIAERAFYDGQGIGQHLGTATTCQDILAWIAQIGAQHDSRAAHAALVALEALIRRAHVDHEIVTPDAPEAVWR